MDEIGAITGYIDVAQLVLYAFWIFFAGLIIYLRMEDKREGYPLESTHKLGEKYGIFFPPYPGEKLFRLEHGEKRDYSSGRTDTREIATEPVAPWEGAPFAPTGDPMADGVGPASYAERADEPDLDGEGQPKVLPTRVADDVTVASRDPDPRGMPVFGTDGGVAGTVRDLWVDRVDLMIRYLEVETAGEQGWNVLLPVPFTKIDKRRGRVLVSAIRSDQFANVPATASPDRVTRLEEDRIAGYFGGGRLYATPERQEPFV